MKKRELRNSGSMKKPFFHSKEGLFLNKKIERRRNAVHTKNRSFFDMHLLYAVFMKKSMVFN